jgi:endonuclease YncB( thermonuclease family)
VGGERCNGSLLAGIWCYACGDLYGRSVAEVFVSARNPQMPEEEKLLNDELVRVGMAYTYRQYSQGCPSGADSLDEAEAEAEARG